MKKNEWTFVSSMAEPHYGHAGTVHGDLMYISGMDKLMDICKCKDDCSRHDFMVRKTVFTLKINTLL